ncbi:hypothetical protein Clacol_003855 [Clathrus columnatus]|uniref:Tetratricopeptide repeat protein 1 n=1 Tax=Clathrus columnatus TaxID=1419009 RepID=A0AAV5A4Q3_9AGAM|nr:hypothetical protein Clacol_003855 [Clathrus columnatus]
MTSITKLSSNSGQEIEPTEYESVSDDQDSGLDGYMTPNEEFELEQESEDVLDEVKVKEALKEAEDIKSLGSDHFRAGEWHEALQEYRRALALLPPKPSGPSVHNKGKGKEKEGSDHDEALETQPSELEQECAKARAILNGNIGACYVKLVRGVNFYQNIPLLLAYLITNMQGDHKKVVEACTAYDPKYIKVLHRRALSNDALGTWTSLTSAEQDYTSLIDMLPADSSILPEIRNALRNLTPRKEAAQSAEMTEMMGKLKGLGNNILGNFGLSTDNFKFEPNGQGGYSVNFVR